MSYITAYLGHTTKKESKLKKFLEKHLTRKNITKVLIIFIIGFITRVFINEVFDINVFESYRSMVSLAHYSFLAIIVAFYDEFSMSFFKSIIKFLIPDTKLSLILGYIQHKFPNEIENLRNLISYIKSLFYKDKISLGSGQSNKKAYKLIEPLKPTVLLMDSPYNEVPSVYRPNFTYLSAIDNYRIWFNNEILRIYGVQQPIRAKYPGLKREYVYSLGSYMEKAAEYEKFRDKNPGSFERKVYISSIGLTPDNLSYISQVIKDNPNSRAYTLLVGRTGYENNLNKVRVTAEIYEILHASQDKP